MHTCGKCPKRWTGAKIAHCASCHESFSTVANFDLHRHNGKCIKSDKLVMGSRGHWIGALPSPFGEEEE